MAREAKPVLAAGEQIPDRVALTGFAALVLIGGLNAPAVKVTVDELAPMWSAGIRFAAAALILLAAVQMKRQRLPRGRALVGAALYGVLSFAGFYAFAYWGIQRLPISVAAVVLASVPLVTFIATVLHRVEPFRWSTLAGALLTIVGIAVMVRSPGSTSISVSGLIAMTLAALCGAEAGVIVKRFPPVPPLMMNFVGMALGGAILLALSVAVQESRAVPQEAATWLGLGYLVLVGSAAMFLIYLYVLRRWTASGTSYAFVLFPIISVIFAALFQNERISGGLIVGGAFVLAGVYVGALLHTKSAETKATEAPPESVPVTEEPRPNVAGVPADCVRCP